LTDAAAVIHHPSPCLGLTGGIGAGKSAALDAFRAAGAATLSSDEVVHDLYRRPEVVAGVAGRFGADVIRDDGSVDRSLVGTRAFAGDGLRFLEQLLHPLIGVARREWIVRERSTERPAALLVCEVPLLFEAGLADVFDAVVVITASEAVRRARVEARGQSFSARAAQQWSEADKVARADHVYVNDGSLEDLRDFVRSIVQGYASTS
jgi:dephospho-CoA kinase